MSFLKNLFGKGKQSPLQARTRPESKLPTEDEKRALFDKINAFEVAYKDGALLNELNDPIAWCDNRARILAHACLRGKLAFAKSQRAQEGGGIRSGPK